MNTRTQHYIAVILYLIAAVILLRQPLFGNFGYEYAAGIAVIASLVAGLRAVRDERRKSDVPAPVRYRDGIWINVVYLLVPLAVAFIASVPRLPCDPAEGLAFYALLPVVSVIFSYTLGWLISLLFRWGRVVFCIVFVLWFCVSVLSTLIQPKIFFYNPFIGFFPGLSYDQLMPVTPTLILYRGYTLFLTLFLALIMYMLRFTSLREASLRDRIRLFYHRFSKSYVSIFLTICIILIAVQLISRGSLGFGTPRGYLESALGEKFKTRSVEIFYSGESFDESEIQWVALEHEFQRHRAMNRLGVAHIRTIRSYIYPDAETKRALIGPANTNIAKPWSREIHLNAPAYRESLYHELVHVIAGAFGMPVLRISDSMAMMEGLAVSAEDIWGNRTLHEHAAAIIQFEIVEDPSVFLDNRGFAMKHSALSYVMMGSFIKYLTDRYGIHRVRIAYPRSDYEKAFDRPREQLVREWMSFLRGISVSERQRLKTQIHFQQPSMFEIRCPRALARLNRSAAGHLAEKRYGEAEQLFQRSWNITENASALSGLIRSWYHLDEHNKILELLGDDYMLDRFPSVIPVLYRTAGDVYAIRGDNARAAQYYRRLLAIDFSDRLNESAWIRLLAIDEPGDTDLWRVLFFESDEREALLGEFAGRDFDELSVGLHWLIADHIHRKGDYARSAGSHITLLERVDNPFLIYMASRKTGEALFYTGKFQEAIVVFWETMNYTSSPAAQYLLNEWIDRADYAGEYGRQIWIHSPPWE